MPGSIAERRSTYATTWIGIVAVSILTHGRQIMEVRMILVFTLCLLENGRLGIPSRCLFSVVPKEYTYPDDADYSIGTYDIVIKDVTWKKHNQMTFACQISSERMRTKYATLTVVGKSLRCTSCEEAGPINSIITSIRDSAARNINAFFTRR